MRSRKLVVRDGGEDGRGDREGKLGIGSKESSLGDCSGDVSAKAKTWTSCALEETATRRDWVWMARPQALISTDSWKNGVGCGGVRGGVAEGDGGLEVGEREARWTGEV